MGGWLSKRASVCGSGGDWGHGHHSHCVVYVSLCCFHFTTFLEEKRRAAERCNDDERIHSGSDLRLRCSRSNLTRFLNVDLLILGQLEVTQILKWSSAKQNYHWKQEVVWCRNNSSESDKNDLWIWWCWPHLQRLSWERFCLVILTNDFLRSIETNTSPKPVSCPTSSVIQAISWCVLTIPILYHWYHWFSTTAVCCICLCPDIKIKKFKQSYIRGRKWTVMNLLTWLLTFKYLECFQTAHLLHFCIYIHQLTAYSHFRDWTQPSSDCFWQYLQLSSTANLTSTPTWGDAWPGVWRWEKFLFLFLCTYFVPLSDWLFLTFWK